MKRLRVKIAPSADVQILEQMLHIAGDSVDRALAWEQRLRLAIRGLGEMHGYSIDEDATSRTGAPTRKMVFEGTYLVHYQIDETLGNVEVIGFRHGARLPRVGEP